MVPAFFAVVPRRGGVARRAGSARRSRHRLEVGSALRPGSQSAPALKPTNDSWRVDETYIRVKGKWRYLYRAVDSSGATLDFLLSARQDAAAAKPSVFSHSGYQTRLILLLLFRLNPIALLGRNLSLVPYHPLGRIAERSVDTLNLA